MNRSLPKGTSGRARSQKILCYVNHYYGKTSAFVGKSTVGDQQTRMRIVEEVVARLRALPAEVDLHVCGFPEASLIPIDVDLSHIGEPRHIVYESIERMFSMTEDYDWFINIEDDILVHDDIVANARAFSADSETNEVWLPNRMEKCDDGTLSCVDMEAMPGWTGLERQFQGEVLGVAKNHHSGLFLLSKEQMRYASTRVILKRRDEFHGGLMASAYANVHAPFLLWRSKSQVLSHHVIHADSWLYSEEIRMAQRIQSDAGDEISAAPLVPAECTTTQHSDPCEHAELEAHNHLEGATKLKSDFQALQRELDALRSSRRMRVANLLAVIPSRFPAAARVAWRLLQVARSRVNKSAPLEEVDSVRLEEIRTDGDWVLLGNGRRIYINPEDHRGAHLIATGGNVNPVTLEMWKLLLASSEWTTIVDVGSNYGEMLVNVDIASHIELIAVEPNPALLGYLDRSLKEAGFNARLERCALSNHSNGAELLKDNQWSGTSRLVGVSDTPLERPADIISVTTKTLGEVIGSKSGEPRRVLVKIDVEGHETSVLEGVVEMLDQFERFAALIEIAHMSTADQAWISENFQISLYDLERRELFNVPNDIRNIADLLKDPRYYSQDVCLTKRRIEG